MQIECAFSTSLFRNDPDEFIRHLDLTVIHFRDDDERLVLGKIDADLLPIADVKDTGASLFDVCKSDSGWEEVYGILFERDDRFRTDLNLSQIAENVLVIWNCLLHPKLDPFRPKILDAVGRLFRNSVVAMWNDTTGLPNEELSLLGFQTVPGSTLIYRDPGAVAAASTNFGNGPTDDLNLDFSDEDEEWCDRNLTLPKSFDPYLEPGELSDDRRDETSGM